MEIFSPLKSRHLSNQDTLSRSYNLGGSTVLLSLILEFDCLCISAECLGGDEVDEFGRVCECGANDTRQSCCRYRQSWSSLSSLDKERYISAVLTVSSDPAYRPLYEELLAQYRGSYETLAQSSVPQSSQFLPWHRYFLTEYEDLLRLVDRSITVPYWDWTVSTSDPYSSPVFDPDTGFGNQSAPNTSCVSNGPFREESFQIASPGDSDSSCLTRDYANFTFFNRDILAMSLALGADMFNEFHNFIQLFVSLNIRCFVGGTLCSIDAASDPLFPLHLVRLDLLVQEWQERNESHDIIQEANEGRGLVQTLDPSLLALDFASNEELPYGTCVRYAPPDPLGAGDEGIRNGDIRCAAEESLKEAAGSLSDEALLYLTRTCDNT